MKKKILAVIMIVILICMLLPNIAFAATHTVSDGWTLNLSATASNDIVEIATGATVTLTGTAPDNVMVQCGAGVNLTLDNVTLNCTTENFCALSFTGDGNTLNLEGKSEIKSGRFEAGMRVQDTTKLTINGPGELNATGGDGGAGIGGGHGGDGGTVTISSGTVTATGGGAGAGIGGGDEGNGGAVTISSGTVTATGGFLGAGIGGGEEGNGGMVNILGGTVIATGGDSATGIGGGWGSNGGTVTITGGTVTATGGVSAAGIGGVRSGDGGTINILGGTVEANGGEDAAGIGGSKFGHGGMIRISGGAVEATGGERGAGIGGGLFGHGGTVTISGGTVTANGGEDAAGIGGGNEGNGGTVTISGGTVTATGSKGGAGIGGGFKGNGGKITIKDGIIVTEKGENAPYDIGNGKYGHGVTLEISGDAVVFLRYNSCIPINTTAHIKLGTMPIVDGKIYGVKVPPGWWNGMIIVPCTLSYDANGGEGSMSSNVTQHINTTINVASQGDLENDRLTFKNWNTDAAGRAYGYAPASEFIFRKDTTLYAIWGDEDVTSISLDQHNINLSQHDTATLVATIEPSDATKNNVVWHSDNTNVASVSQSGVVTAVGIGSATITAYADGKSDTCNVTVAKKAVTSVTITGTSSTMTLGDTMLLDVTILPDNATYSDVTWISNDSSIAIVDQNGMVSAVGIGDVTIGAEVDGVTDSYDINVVKNSVISVRLNKTSHIMKEGDELSLNATISPNDATNTDVSWRSSDDDVAIVNRNGVVTAVGAGSATIRAEVDDIMAYCKVMVEQSVLGVSISNPVETMTVGDKVRMFATITPNNASELLVTWSSKDESIVRVDTSGNVIAVGEGRTSIVLTVDDMSDACAVVVTKKEGEDTPSKVVNPKETIAPTEPKNTNSPQATPDNISTGKEIVIINVQDLPEGTKAVKTPSGEVISIDGDEVEIEIDGSNDMMQIIALDEDDVPLGYFSLEIIAGQVKSGFSIWVIILGVVIGILVVGGVMYIRNIKLRK